MESNAIGIGDIFEYELDCGDKCVYEVSRFEDDIIHFSVDFDGTVFDHQLYDGSLDNFIKMGAMKLIKKG